MAEQKKEFKDEEGDNFWSTAFGDKDKVEVSTFATNFRDATQCKFPIEMMNIVAANIIDTVDKDGFVSKAEFDLFLKRFGAFKESANTVCTNLFDSQGRLYPWYHGTLGRAEADQMLRKPGNFLLRFSDNFPTKFTLAYAKIKDGKIAVKSILIHHSRKGFCLQGQETQCFATLSELCAKEGNCTIAKPSAVYTSLYGEEKSSNNYAAPALTGSAANAYGMPPSAASSVYGAAPLTGDLSSLSSASAYGAPPALSGTSALFGSHANAYGAVGLGSSGSSSSGADPYGDISSLTGDLSSLTTGSAYGAAPLTGAPGASPYQDFLFSPTGSADKGKKQENAYSAFKP